MSNSEEWEQFTAYIGIIEDAKRRERERIIYLLQVKWHNYIELGWRREADIVSECIALIEARNV